MNAAYQDVTAFIQQKFYPDSEIKAAQITLAIKRIIDSEPTMNITFERTKRGSYIHPKHKFIKNWAFNDSCKDESYNEKEANLADAMARIAEANGMNVNDMHHSLPAVLRMLKSDSNWAK
jgi:uncharacterized protein (DUF2267 family)